MDANLAFEFAIPIEIIQILNIQIKWAILKSSKI